MQPPYNKSSCAAKNTISNPMGIGFGMDYVTWSNIQKWMLPTPNLHVGHKRKFPILWVYGSELTISLAEISKNGSAPHQIFRWDKKLVSKHMALGLLLD